MNGKLFAKLIYTSENLGDDIQTLATLPFLGFTPIPFDRDTLALEKSAEKYILIMNGWWAAKPQSAFPPADCFIPIFIGFHIAREYAEYFITPKCIEYFKKYQPIGCRDTFTLELLKKKGVDTFFSGCLSTTFGNRTSEPKEEAVYLIDAERIDHLVPDRIKKNARRLTHRFTGIREEREQFVNELMDHYRNRATLVITTRLHAALPCIALGVPVVFFFHPDDPRSSTAIQLGLKLYPPFLSKPRLFRKILVKTQTSHLWSWLEKRMMSLRYATFQKINWNPKPINIEQHKMRLQETTKEMIQKYTDQR